MKRFYKETATEAGEGGFHVLLDGKPMRTPAKSIFVVPTEPLAQAIAGEWGEGCYLSPGGAFGTGWESRQYAR